MINCALPVPSVTYEDLNQVPQLALPNTAKLAGSPRTFRSAITPKITPRDFHPASVLIVEMEEALLALRNFERRALLAPTHSSVTADALKHVLVQVESIASSQLEQLPVNAKQLSLANLDHHAPGMTAGIANVLATQAALNSSVALTVSALMQMHRPLLAHARELSHYAGVIRNVTVWIGDGSSSGPSSATFVPPRSDLVPGTLKDLESFMARTDLPSLLQIAITHAQFETIHPFVDGNGRAGRALIQAMLFNFGVSMDYVLPISSGILANREGYFTALTAYRNGNAAPIVRLFTQAIRHAAHHGTQLIANLQQQLDSAHQLLIGMRPHATAWKLIPTLVEQPVVDANYVKGRLGVNDAAANRTLTALTERGVLTEASGNKRNRIWQHDGILNVLHSFAEQSHPKYW